MNPTQQEALRQQHKMSLVIAVAMAATLPIYAAVLELWKRTATSPIGFIEPVEAVKIRYGIFLVAVACVFLTRIIKARVLAHQPTATASSEGSIQGAIQRLMSAFLVTYTLADAPAILGLAFFFLTGETRTFYMLSVISIYLFVVHAPRYDQWEAWIASRYSIGTTHWS